MPPRRSATANIVFLVIWLVFWASAILVAIWTLGGTVLQGNLAAGAFLVVWLVAAGFGFLQGARKLVRLLLHGRDPRPPMRDHRWDDGIDPPPR